MHIQFPLVQQYLGTSQARQYRYRYSCTVRQYTIPVPVRLYEYDGSTRSLPTVVCLWSLLPPNSDCSFYLILF
jgi:hypothetical protein